MPAVLVVWPHALGGWNMRYALLCYHQEDVVCAWSKEEDADVMAKIAAVKDRLGPRIGTNLRLMPTTTATTLRKDRDPPLVLDGPFAETKEQLLGLYLLECASLEEALDVAKELAKANPGGSYEVRPIAYFDPRSIAK
jgi:hypothetical protein